MVNLTSYDSETLSAASISQILDTVNCNIYSKKPNTLDAELSRELIKKVAHLERDLNSARTQADLLSAEIELSNNKHRPAMQKQGE